MSVKFYINLTNGIKAIESLKLKDFSYIRIQSTACEQKRWNFIIQDLDNDLLMNLALGNICIICDYSSKKYMPRSCYQGLEIIRYILNKKWFNREIKPIINGHNCTKYCREIYKNMPKNIHKKLEYFKKFLMTDQILLVSYSGKTKNDTGDFNYYTNLLSKNVNLLN